MSLRARGHRATGYLPRAAARGAARCKRTRGVCATRAAVRCGRGVCVARLPRLRRPCASNLFRLRRAAPHERHATPLYRLRDQYVGLHGSGFRDFMLKPEIMRAIVDCAFEHPSTGAVIGLRHAAGSCGAKGVCRDEQTGVGGGGVAVAASCCRSCRLRFTELHCAAADARGPRRVARSQQRRLAAQGVAQCACAVSSAGGGGGKPAWRRTHYNSGVLAVAAVVGWRSGRP